MKHVYRVAICLAVSCAFWTTSVPASDPLDARRAVSELDRGGVNHYILCLQPCSDPSSWTPTGSLNTPRAHHTATLLPNGKVLVAGGRSTHGDPLDSAELYDPATGTWSMTGPLNLPRDGHTATLLADGKVLVAGGDTSRAPPFFGRTGTAELYDPDTGTWSLTGEMSAPRWAHTATLLQSGKVLVAGGSSAHNTLDSAELFDPATGAWSPTGSLIAGRYLHTATLLQDGTVLVARGSDDGDLTSTLSSAELYDPAAGTWSATAGTSAESVLHTATLLPTGEVLLVGGYTGGVGGGAALTTSELYDPATRSWRRRGDLAAARFGHTATLLPNARVLVAAGMRTEQSYPLLHYRVYTAAESYDLGADAWSMAATLGGERSFHTATLLSDGRVLVAGGAFVGANYTNNALSSAELYQPRSP